MKTKEHKKFKPFDKVLVKDINPYWSCEFYSHFDSERGTHETTALCNVEDDAIIPYEGNEHLVGTADEPEDVIKLENEYVIGITFDEEFHPNLKQPFIFGKVKSLIKVGDSEYFDFGIYTKMYASRFSDFNPNDMEVTRKHILCVKNGKVVRYKEGME